MKVLKVIGKILLILLIVILLFMAGLFIYNRVKLAQEDKLLDQSYPGKFVEVNGHKMNVYVSGEGEHTLVFLAPAGDPFPVLSFEPLYSKLNGDYKTVVIEKFGYGRSDIVDGERDYKAMVEECREALSKSGVNAPYILCPYSKSGLDALIWTQSYPDEVEAIISLDMAFPGHYDDLDLSGNSMSTFTLMSFLKGSGIGRLIITDSMFPEDMPAESIAMGKALIMRNYSNITTFNEILTVPAACDIIKSGAKPACPMLLFLSDGGGTGMDTDTWREHAYEYTDGLNTAAVLLDSGHGGIIEKFSGKMADEIKTFVEDL